jgi:hypothetical protein
MELGVESAILEEMGCMGDVCCRDYLKNEWLARKQEGKP